MQKPHIRIHSDMSGALDKGCQRCVFGKGVKHCTSKQIVGRDMRCTKNRNFVSYELVSGELK